MNEVISDVLAIGAVVGLFGMLGAVIWLAAVNEHEIKKERHRLPPPEKGEWRQDD